MGSRILVLNHCAQSVSRVWLCNPRTVAHQLLCPWTSPGKNTGVDTISFPRGILPTQRLNLDLLHCRRILYHLNHQGSPLNQYTCSFSWAHKILHQKCKVQEYIFIPMGIERVIFFFHFSQFFPLNNTCILYNPMLVRKLKKRWKTHRKD